MGLGRNSYKILLHQSLGRHPKSRRRWKDNIRKDLKEISSEDGFRGWKEMSWDRVQ
jgi:hypothetical protein